MSKIAQNFSFSGICQIKSIKVTRIISKHFDSCKKSMVDENSRNGQEKIKKVN